MQAALLKTDISVLPDVTEQDLRDIGVLLGP
jgi:hypothetical protein